MRMRTTLGVADTHTYTCIFRCAKRTVNGFDAVMSARGATSLDLDASEFQVHVVVNHHDVVGLDLIVGADGGHGIARVVHVGQRLGQKELDGATVKIHRALTEHGKTLVIGEVHAPAFGEHVGCHEAHVVSRVLIFLARVAQSRNQPKIRCHIRSSSCLASLQTQRLYLEVEIPVGHITHGAGGVGGGGGHEAELGEAESSHEGD